MIKCVEVTCRTAMERANRSIECAPNGGFAAEKWYFNKNQAR